MPQSARASRATDVAQLDVPTQSIKIAPVSRSLAERRGGNAVRLQMGVVER